MASKGAPILSLRLPIDLSIGLTEVAKKSDMTAAAFVRALIELAVETDRTPPESSGASVRLVSATKPRIPSAARRTRSPSVPSAPFMRPPSRSHAPNCKCPVCQPPKRS
jgi:hypothetical protein